MDSYILCVSILQKSVIPQMSLQSPIAPGTPNGFPTHNGFTPDHVNENDVSARLSSFDLNA